MIARSSLLSLLLAASATGSLGCELIATVDRTKITGQGGSDGGGGTGNVAGGGAGGGGVGGVAGGGTGGMAGGGTGGMAGGGGGGGMGGGDTCQQPSDCPDPGNECVTRTCVDNLCGIDPVPSGTPLANQTAGDCQLAVCDGAGSTGTENVDDPEDDLDPCTDDICDQGVNTHPFTMPGTTCGVDLVCDGAGACVGCVDAADCPAAPNECSVPACNAGVCGLDAVMMGVEANSQSDGDCMVTVCDGNGGFTDIPDDGDVPDDLNDCTIDGCDAGAPEFTNTAPGTGCGASLVCDGNGACVGCNAPADCGTDGPCVTFTCVANTCGSTFQPEGTVVGAGTAGDCRDDVCDAVGNVVAAGGVNLLDAPAPDAVDCTVELCDAISTNPSSEPAAEGTSCDDDGGFVCNDSGMCVDCVAPSDCGVDTECAVQTCVANTCGVTFTPSGTPLAAQTLGDCLEAQCDGAGGTTDAILDTDEPLDTACTTGLCTLGVPSNPPVTDGTECGFGGTCTAGVCGGVCAVPVIDQDLGSATGNAVASGTTVGAGNDYASAACQSSAGSADLAFYWEPPADGCYSISTEGSAIGDTVLSVRRCTDNGSEACDDDGGTGNLSQLTIDVLASESFVIVVDGFGSSNNGNYVLNINPVACPLPPTESITACPAELCTFAAGAGPNGGDTFTYVLPGSAHPTVGDFGNVAACASYGNGRDLLLQLDATGYTNFTVNTCTAGAGDSSVAAYDAAPATGTMLGCNSDALGGPSFCSKLGNPAVSGGSPVATALNGNDLFVVVDEFSSAGYWNGTTTRTIVVELIP
jgi:hypothetical protein